LTSAARVDVNPIPVRAWLRAVGVCLVWFGFIAIAIGGMYWASIPDVPAITEIDAAASHAAEPGASTPPQDSDWKRYSLPLRICQIHCDTLYTVYRHRFVLDQLPLTDLALYLPFFDANIAVYLNGEKIDQRGRMVAPVDVYRFHSRLVQLPAARLRVGENSLMLQLVAERRHVGGLSPFYLAPIEALAGAQRWRARLTEHTVAGIGWLQAGSLLVALVLFLSGRRESLLGWYLVAAVFWLFLIVLHASPTLIPGNPWRWTSLFISIAGVLSFSPLFIIGILQPPPRWMVRSLVVFFGICVTLILLGMHGLSLNPYWQFQLPNYTLKFSGYLLVPLMLWLVSRIVLKRERSWSAAWLLAFAAMPGVLGIADAVWGTVAPPLQLALLPLGGLGVSLALWLELTRRLIENHRRMASHAAELEVTVRAREADLHESYERLRSADRDRALAEERQRLLRDMHDGVGGQLASLVHLAGNPDIGREQVVAGLREGLADLRLVLDSLAQGEDDPMVALGRLRHRIQPTLEAAGIALHWEVDPDLDLPAWSPEAVLHIYRLLQEATNNAIRHAHARTLTIGVQAVGGRIDFSVVDDGVGIDPDALVGRGYGLDSLRARALKLGGELALRSTPGHGTAVIVSLPRAGRSALAFAAPP
jgi:signal transduction histidine kinase